MGLEQGGVAREGPRLLLGGVSENVYKHNAGSTRMNEGELSSALDDLRYQLRQLEEQGSPSSSAGRRAPANAWSRSYPGNFHHLAQTWSSLQYA